ncbi:GAF domain-containing protein [Coriobacteriales bacterium OH1046]|nr:GAF domain-containing protein [Coriobacteriales bacterium OH1046]
MDYHLLARQLEALSEGERSWLPLLSNASALLDGALDDINWVGFYLVQDDEKGVPELVLGPFQGKVACARIAWGSGVCGTAAAADTAQRVDDVHEFAGHIACDGASNSEMVFPLHRDGAVWGVLDIDSPSPARFSSEDQEGLETFVRALEAALAATR